MRLVKLTAPDRTAVWIAPAWVLAVRQPDGAYSARAKAIVVMSGNNQAVLESPVEVVKALEAS